LIHYLVLFMLSFVPVLGCASTAPSTTTSSHATPPLEVGETTDVVEGPIADDDEPNPGPYLFTMPVVRGGAPGVAERINEALTPDHFNAGASTGSSFSVNLRRGHLLALEIHVSPTCGAYCEGDAVWRLLFDTDTGGRIATRELFDAQQLPALTTHVEAMRVAIAQKAMDDLDEATREELHWFADTLEPYFADDGHAALGDAASLSDAGLSFATDYDFPHYAKALEPAWPRLTWAEIAPYLAPRFRDLAK